MHSQSTETVESLSSHHNTQSQPLFQTANKSYALIDGNTLTGGLYKYQR